MKSLKFYPTIPATKAANPALRVPLHGFRGTVLLSPTLVLCLLLGSCGGGSGSGADNSVDLPVIEPPAAPTVERPDEPPKWPEPAIVLILVDDLGYGSLNSYGAYRELVRTPQIDRLAADGVRFSQANAPSSVCSPTRYGVLMGRYPWRTELKVGVVNPLDPLWPSQQLMNLPKWLKTRGYSTATIGKWHLGYGTERHTRDIEDWINSTMPGPEALGFDYSFNVPQNHGDIFGVYFENGKVVGYDNGGQLVGLQSTAQKDYGNTTYGSRFIGFDTPQRTDSLVTEQITTRAIQWMEEQVSQDEGPFFLYFTPVAVHEPITPSVEASGSSGVGPYGDFIHDLDRSVGRILDALEEMGIDRDTVVIFTSDNGGEIPGSRETPQRLAIRRGLTINGSLRGDKHTIWEGGTRVPLIVRMAGYNQVAGGTVSEALVNLTDIFATIVDLVGDGASLPDGVGTDSISFLHAVQTTGNQDKPLRTSSVTANVNGIIALRSGDWKLIEGILPDEFQGTSPEDETGLQLYNLRDYPAETREVSHLYPEIVEQLQQELKAIRDSN